MRFSRFACTVLALGAAPLASAQEPVACWDYTTISDNVGSRLGLRGAPDDTILSRSAYYTLTKLPSKLSMPMTGGYGSWFKVEFRADAEGADAPLALSGLLVDLDNITVDRTIKTVKYESHVDGNGRVQNLSLVPLEARFRAGDKTLVVPFRTQGPDLQRQDVTLRLGSFAPPTRLVGGGPAFDAKATLPLLQEVEAAWQAAGTMTIEFALPEGGAVVATSQPLGYVGDKMRAEFAKMNGRAREMLSGGKCQYLSD